MNDTRRERQLGNITLNKQLYEAEKVADWIDAIKHQICPFCGSGPFIVVALHVSMKHGIDHHELRRWLGVNVHDVICDEFYSKTRSKIARSLFKAGAIDPRKANRAREPKARLVGRGPWCGTRDGYGNHGCRCVDCRNANAEATRKYLQKNPDQYRKKRERTRAVYYGAAVTAPPGKRPPAKCGTIAGHERHCRLGEMPCTDCKAARLAYEAKKTTKRRPPRIIGREP